MSEKKTYLINGLWSPGCMDCSLSMHQNEKNIFVQELIFSYDCAQNCPYCTIYHRAKRTVKFDKAVEIIQKAAENAKLNKREKVYIHFVGGDPFEKFDLFREICEWVYVNYGSEYLKIGVTTSFIHLTDEMLMWLGKYPDFMKLEILHWFLKPSNLSGAQMQFLKQKTASIRYRICHDKVAHGGFIDELKELCKYELPVLLSYDDVTKWTEEEITGYQTALVRELSKEEYGSYSYHPGLKECFMSLGYEHRCFDEAGIFIRATDTTGEIYPCRMCSMLSTSIVDLQEYSTWKIEKNVKQYSNLVCQKNLYCEEMCNLCDGEKIMLASQAQGKDKVNTMNCRIMQINRNFLIATANKWKGR